MRWLPCAALGLCVCAPDSIVLEPALEPAELAEVCGQQGPVQVLPFQANDSPPDQDKAVKRIGDRIYFVIARGVALDQAVFGQVTVTSTGPCGEDARVVATDLIEVFEHERWPGLVLGSGIDLSLVVIDPEGLVPPRPLLPPAFFRGWSAHGVVAQHPIPPASGVELRLTPYPAGPDEKLEPIVLFESEAVIPGVAVLEHDVFLLESGNLVHVSLPDGAATVERTGITGFKVSDDARFVLAWNGAFNSTRSLELFDRQTGELQPLGQLAEHLPHMSQGHVAFTPRGPEPLASRIIRLPDLETIDGPAGVELEFAVDDTRWIGHDRGSDTYVLFDTATNATSTLLPYTDEPIFHSLEDPDRLEAFLEDEDGSGSLHAAWFDGRAPRELATRASADHHHVQGGRIVTPIRSDDGEATVLGLTDREGTTRWFVDTHVVPFVARLQHGAGYDDDEVIYAVDDVGRSGMWLARLPPPR